MDGNQIVVYRCGPDAAYLYTALLMLLDRCRWNSESGVTEHAQDGDDHVFFNDLALTEAWCKACGYTMATSDDPPPWPSVLSQPCVSSQSSSQRSQQPSQRSQQPSQRSQSSQQSSQPLPARKKHNKRRRIDDDDDDVGVAAVTDGSDDEDLDDTGSDLADFVNDGDSDDDDEGPRNMTTPSIPMLSTASDDEWDEEELQPLEQWLADERKSVLMIGGGGTGKTELIVRAVEMLRRRGLNPLITGSSGRAAITLQERFQSQRHLTPSWPELPQVCTAHSADAFQLADVVAASASGPEAVKMQVQQLLQRRKPATMEELRAADVVIIDEISMVSAEDLALFCAVAAKAQAPREPVFLMVGDFYQLQPVSGEPCFDSPDMCRLTGNWRRVHILGKNRRQAEDPEFARMLEQVRCGNFTDEVMQYLRAMSRSAPPEGVMCITPQNRMCDVLNDRASRRLADAEAHDFSLQNAQLLTGVVSRQGNRSILSKRPLPPKMMPRLQTPLIKSLQAHVLTLRVGDMVMIKANIDTKGGIANGVRGEVVGFAVDKRIKNKPNDVVLVKRQEDSQIIRIPYIPQTRDGWSDEGTRWRTAVYYMSLVRAWAITVHNAQGATIRSPFAIYLTDEQDNVLLFGDWARLLYVALSRATNSRQVYLVGFDKVDQHRLIESCREPNRRLGDWMDQVLRVRDGCSSSNEASQHGSSPYDPPPLLTQRPSFRKSHSLLRVVKSIKS